MRRFLYLLFSLVVCQQVFAIEILPGEVNRIATRENVSVPVFAYWQNNAKATVALFSGGAGGYGKIGDDGWPAGGNFLIRTGKHWASFPLNIVMVGRPSDQIDLSNGAIRIGQEHNADNAAIFKWVKQRSTAPLWVVGTSMGTISATAAAIEDKDKLISGVALTSSITAYKIPGAVPRQELENIRVPVLVLHHRDDACWACQANEAKDIEERLKNAPIRKTVIVSGGSDPTGNPCQPKHYHGFIGMENEAVDIVARWIIHPEN